MEPVLTSRDGEIATVTLNNPDKLNALSRPMWQRLGEIMRELSADDSLRCVVVRGVGYQAFAAGADISEFARERADSRQAQQYGALIRAATHAVVQCRHPVIAMIRGVCIGGGLEIAAMCDMRICGESSRFGVPIKNLGLTMGYSELRGLLAVVGRTVTLEILLEGRVFDAAEALQKRLVNRVVPDVEVKREAYALAQRIASGAPLVARWHKQFINKLSMTPQNPVAEGEGYACFDTEDYRIGVQAFLAKTKPKFKGR